MIRVALSGAIFAVFSVLGSSVPVLPAYSQAAELPLIPLEAFYGEQEGASGYIVSSDGAFLAYVASDADERSLIVKSRIKDDVLARFPANVNFVRWHPEKPLLRFGFEGHDWEVDPFAPARGNWKI